LHVKNIEIQEMIGFSAKYDDVYLKMSNKKTIKNWVGLKRASLFFDLGSLFFNLTSFFRPWITFFDLGSLFLDLDLLFLKLGMFLLTLAYFPILVWNLAPSFTFSLCV
jgi:hypothetical protein